MIGAPIFAFGGVGVGEVIGRPTFGGISGAGGVVGTLTLAVGTTGAGGAAAFKPALVSTIGDIGADCQSSPSSTLPSAIASTAP